ncbi:CG0192-related protein [Phytohabitans houttuyneae]|uniref:Maltokinase N-terminal cap domain-containing protein n=1 Tax=Phytohabitans houttuyneae TaxID=1076126 RepID=A0A6V8JYF9_9ACTN|nr:hypothetical protein [Phytohabitans houttuyneae]GFJ76330.1 hypothetical protein Phou_005100 [Phytohabitans houttuyneae]
MALLHRATLRPTKLELLAAWLPTRSWYGQPPGEVERVAAFRFDDPAGAVGVETLLVRAGDGPVYQVPLTYRDAPLADGDDFLLGTTEHSVLGRRWVYDACGDPVYVTALAEAVSGRVAQAEEFLDVDGELQRREPSMRVAGTGAGDGPAAGAVRRVVDGDPTLIVTDAVELAVVRRLPGADGAAGAALTGTWDGQADPLPLVRLA